MRELGDNLSQVWPSLGQILRNYTISDFLTDIFSDIYEIWGKTHFKEAITPSLEEGYGSLGFHQIDPFLSILENERFLTKSVEMYFYHDK